VREICTLRAMRRELETWPRENCEPTEQSKELDWKPSPYRARASSRPYRARSVRTDPHPTKARSRTYDLRILFRDLSYIGCIV
jgi:hypothetical protein